MYLDWQKKIPDTKFTHVFYKGAADQNAALLGGEVDFIIGNINDVMRSINEFRILNVAAEKRNDFLPHVPTLRESGIDIVSDIRRIFAMPKGVDPKILEEVRAIFRKICEDPDYLSDMKKAGQPAEYMDGPELEAYVRELAVTIEQTLREDGLLKN